MRNPIPSPADVRARLFPLSAAQLESLASECGVPVTTLVKVRNGQTGNPRLGTVHAIWPRLMRRKAIAPIRN